ncbi:10277_t:CDS:2 [Racocetra persica]|uniref:10277_t:CDS:1 n=1 Tax=Racocetra persica TaxID=160502 RepID=A0ACA9LL93_9GLOM|nr:10277_t:CDS:2 [Racocetra persica]
MSEETEYTIQVPEKKESLVKRDQTSSKEVVEVIRSREIPEEKAKIMDLINIPEFLKPIIEFPMNNIRYFVTKNDRAKLVTDFDFKHQDQRLYFWFDKTGTKLSKYNHVSFDKESFNFLRTIPLKSEDHFKVYYFDDNYSIFVLMLFMDFY